MATKRLKVFLTKQKRGAKCLEKKTSLANIDTLLLLLCLDKNNLSNCH